MRCPFLGILTHYVTSFFVCLCTSFRFLSCVWFDLGAHKTGPDTFRKKTFCSCVVVAPGLCPRLAPVCSYPGAPPLHDVPQPPREESHFPVSKSEREQVEFCSRTNICRVLPQDSRELGRVCLLSFSQRVSPEEHERLRSSEVRFSFKVKAPATTIVCLSHTWHVGQIPATRADLVNGAGAIDFNYALDALRAKKEAAHTRRQLCETPLAPLPHIQFSPLIMEEKAYLLENGVAGTSRRGRSGVGNAHIRSPPPPSIPSSRAIVQSFSYACISRTMHASSSSTLPR